MDRGGSAVVRKDICRENKKQRGTTIFGDRDFFVCSAVATDCIYLSAIYENGTVQLLQHEIYWTEEICWSGKLCGCVPPDGDLSRLVGKRVLYGRSGGSVSFSIVLCHFDGIQSEGRICV